MSDNKSTKQQSITPRDQDYSQWYLDIVREAELAENSRVRGSMVIKPHGYAIWELTQRELNERFKETGVQNAYFPMLIPQSLLSKEEDHVEGFAPEVAVVTRAGDKDLEEPLVIRPTSETIMYDTFSNWIESYRDLPLLLNQWANVVRWEMRTRPFLRTAEFLWQEGHTVHATVEEADERARQMHKVYQDFFRDFMAIPVVMGAKSESEKFAGALHTYTCEAMMQDGKALQIATSHNLGDNFAKAFDIKFLDKDEQWKHAWQTSWGLSTRSIGGLIMTHSDDKGLVLPPKIAAIKVVVIPIFNEENKPQVLAAADKLRRNLVHDGLLSSEIHIDDRDLRPGPKFFEWERKGIPLRIELGPRDIDDNQCVVVERDTDTKTVVSLDEHLPHTIAKMLVAMQQRLLDVAEQRLSDNTVSVDNWEDFTQAIEEQKFVLAHWSGDEAVEKQIKDETGATTRCIPFDQPEESGVCIKSGNPSSRRVLFAKNY